MTPDTAGISPLTGAAPLTVLEVAVPPLPVPNYTTYGTFPQVFGPGSSLVAVDATLKATLVNDEEQYAASARKDEAVNDSTVFDPGIGAGVYYMLPDRNLISASTVVVSALVPAGRYFPGGTDSNGWLAVTVRVPSGAVVSLSSLFVDPTRGLARLAAAFKAEAVRNNSCVSQGLLDPTIGSLIAQDFEPTIENYQYFALTSNGVAIGFPAGQGGSPACGSLERTVPYDVLQPYLNDFGKSLVAGVRSPKN